MQNQWFQKKVAFLGDSITDKDQLPINGVYWQFLQESLGLIPLVYGINGDQWCGIKDQARSLFEDHGTNVDAISIFVGTNDFNGSVPLGEWFSFTATSVENRCKGMICRQRTPIYDPCTVRGRINIAMAFIKEKFPLQQIFLVTPIHRAYANFGETNVQLDESFPNQIGLYIDDYVNVIKEAGNIWAVPVLDMNAACGLHPLTHSHAQFFRNPETDLLHPTTAGHRRMASVMQYFMLAMPSTFR